MNNEFAWIPACAGTTGLQAGGTMVLYFVLVYIVSVASLYTVRERVLWGSRSRWQDVVIALLGSGAAIYIQSWPELLMLGGLVAAGRTDLDAYVVPQCFSVWLIPVGVLCAIMNWSAITWWESVVAALIGYGFLWGVNRLFVLVKNQPGIGIGDMEVLAMIGSFVGVATMWDILLISSISGLIIALVFTIYQRRLTPMVRFPFASFLLLGTCIYYLWC